jgi:ParB family chromosome partitioning protein
MELQFIELGKLSISKANMRYTKKAPDVSDILPTVRARGVLVPLIVRRNPVLSGVEGCGPDAYEIVAGARRFTAARLIAEEAEEDSGEPVTLPCAIIENGDDAAAIETSLIENVARRDADEVSQWTTFVRLIREGRSPADISATFGLPELGVKRILALGNLLPRIRSLYGKGEIDAATVRHLTLASKAQQKAWLALFDDADAYCPSGHQLKSWLFGGQSIKVDEALFDVEASRLAVIADLFGEDRYFADSDAFWEHQNAAIVARRVEYLDAGWSDVVIVPPGGYFSAWEHEKAAKRNGGRVYIDVRQTGEVTFLEGYVTRKEARRLEKGETISSPDKPSRPELTSTLTAYVDLHRHAAVRAAMTAHTGVALRLMVAHAISGSPLWSVKPEPQTSRNEAVQESVELSRAEAAFDAKRRAVLDLLGFSAEEPVVTRGNGDPYGIVGLFLRLLDLSDAAVMDVIAIVMGESLAAGSAVVDAAGAHIGVDMSRHWQADDALFECLRDREVLTAMIAEVAGEVVAAANAQEKSKTLKTIIRDHLAGENGRARVTGWVPKWMAFPPSAYTQRGGVGSVDAAALVAAARADRQAPPTPEAEAEAEPQPQAA